MLYGCNFREIIVYFRSIINAYSLISHEWWVPLIKFMVGLTIHVTFSIILLVSYTILLQITITKKALFYLKSNESYKFMFNMFINNNYYVYIHQIQLIGGFQQINNNKEKHYVCCYCCSYYYYYFLQKHNQKNFVLLLLLL